MKSAETMKDQERKGWTSQDRKAAREGGDASLRLPFGVAGVAGLCALALGLFGLFMPRAWLETISFQLYLDRISSAALPPLGTTAQILAALVLALGGALFGWIIGRLFGVRSSSLSFHSLINRLRGIGAGDEADAPSLRAADRHPDAPARRPFSAARDIARYEDEWDDEEDALLLDRQFAAADDAAPTPPPLGATTGTSFDDQWRQPLMPQSSGLADEVDAFDLPAPSLEDWEAAPEAAPMANSSPFPPSRPVPPPSVTVPPAEPTIALAPVAATPPPAPAPAPTATPAPAPAPAVAPIIRHAGAPEPSPEPWSEPRAAGPTYAQRAKLPPIEPLDLSAARLDDLLARLENGLGRRSGQAPSAPTASAVAGLTADSKSNSVAGPRPSADGAAPAVEPTQATRPAPQDPAYPQDPALAAALRTLRRMNQQATA